MLSRDTRCHSIAYCPSDQGRISFPTTWNRTSSLGMPKDGKTDKCTPRDAQRPTSQPVSQPAPLGSAHPLLDPKIPSSWRPSGARVPPLVTDPATAKRPALCSPGPSCPHSCRRPLPPSSSTWALLSSHTQLPTIPGHPIHFTPLCQGCWALPFLTQQGPAHPSRPDRSLGAFSPDTQEPSALPAPRLCMAFSLTRQEALKDRIPISGTRISPAPGIAQGRAYAK